MNLSNKLNTILEEYSKGDKKSAYKKTSVKSEEGGTATKLRELNQLYKEGVITKKEFTEAKKKYLK